MSRNHRPNSPTGDVTKPRLGDQGKKCEQSGNVSRNGRRNPLATFFVSSPLLTRPHFSLLGHEAQPSVTYLGHKSKECLKTIRKVKEPVVAHRHIKRARLFSAHLLPGFAV